MCVENFQEGKVHVFHHVCLVVSRCVISKCETFRPKDLCWHDKGLPKTFGIVVLGPKLCGFPEPSRAFYVLSGRRFTFLGEKFGI